MLYAKQLDVLSCEVPWSSFYVKEHINLLSKVLSEGGEIFQEAGNQLGDYGYNPSER